MREAFSTLLRLGETAQREIYNEWFRLSADGKPENSLFDAVSKIDLSSSTQVRLLIQYFRHNVGTIGFFLDSCVFPVDMMVYSQKLVATSWDLATNEHMCTAGFSGTSDSSELLPLHVSPIDPGDLLRGTDGKMLRLLVNCAEFTTLDTGAPGTWPLADMAIQATSADRRVSALIDAGALMVGSSNEEVADHLMEIDACNKTSGIFS